MDPVFVIHDIEQEFHTAYNTAAKTVAILEKNDLVKEISSKQKKNFIFIKYFSNS